MVILFPSKVILVDNISMHSYDSFHVFKFASFPVFKFPSVMQFYYTYSVMQFYTDTNFFSLSNNYLGISPGNENDLELRNKVKMYTFSPSTSPMYYANSR